ncbi:MAG: metallophosphoesterase family protein [Verrucomicrobia bacterium]|nr:metallophosphoesterase family protein [Verrucomicrobiota bacterium]
MPTRVTRILSDVHYGDRGSRVRALPALRPLFEGVDQLVLNGDTIDTRPSKVAGQSEALRAETLQFFRDAAPPVTFLTGNHDPDISALHTLDLADGRVFVTHGDILFEEIVPWGQDAATVRRRIREQLGELGPDRATRLEHRFTVFRRVAATIPQRHQSERDALKYTVGILADTVWPPTRFLHILRAWRNAPALAGTLTRRYRPKAGFVLIGHIHRPGFWRLPDGLIVINTGSYCPPLSGWVADLQDERLILRMVERRKGEFHPGRVIAEFSTAAPRP